MVGRIHVLQIRRKIFIGFRLFAFIVEVPEIKIGTLLRQKGGNNDESPFWRPVNCIAILSINSADMFEVSDRRAFRLFRAEEGH